MSITVTKNIQKVFDLFTGHSAFTKASVDVPDEITVKQIASKYNITGKNLIKFIFEFDGGVLNIVVTDNLIDSVEQLAKTNVAEEAFAVISTLSNDHSKNITFFIDPETKVSSLLYNNRSLAPISNYSDNLSKLLQLIDDVDGVEAVTVYELYGEDKIVISCKVAGHTLDTVPADLIYNVFSAIEPNHIVIEYSLTSEIYDNEDLHDDIVSKLKQDLERL